MTNLAGQAVVLTGALRNQDFSKGAADVFLSYITIWLLATCEKKEEIVFFLFTSYITKTFKNIVATAIKIAVIRECSTAAACVGTGCLSTITSCISPTPLEACRSKSLAFLMSSLPYAQIMYFSSSTCQQKEKKTPVLFHDAHMENIKCFITSRLSVSQSRPHNPQYKVSSLMWQGSVMVTRHIFGILRQHIRLDWFRHRYCLAQH